ncbi:MAG: PhnD/SsuA/transferrin family substrate-binding protein [Paracoccaceae bacterium]|nr:PhnD/SsuA/transferrin family substrate-binding protein [Paracoccaceae bacterium]
MIASLGMYDPAECQPANDRYWALIRDGLRARGLPAPDTLTRGEAAYWPAWQAADLVLSQTCGFPYRARLHGKVTLIGTPDFGVDGCPPGYYRSLFLARNDDPRPLAGFDGGRFTYNDKLSQSGWAAPRNHAQALGLHLPTFLHSGGHLASALAVAERRADLAAIDAVTWRLILRHDPALCARRRGEDQTTPTPGLPYIAAPGADRPALFAVIGAAIASLSAADRDTLGLRGLIAIPAARYLAVPTPQETVQSAR